MPGPGQKNVTIPEKIWDLAYKEAEKEDPENPSVAGWISRLVKKEASISGEETWFERENLERLEEEKKEKQRRKEYEKVLDNVQLIVSIRSKPDRRKKINQRRIRAAIYRLYNSCNLSTHEIAERTGIREFEIKQRIGVFFKNLCLKRESCIFKPLLEEIISRP